MSKHELPSGAILEVTPLPFEQAWEVAQTLSKVAQSVKVDPKAFGGDSKEGGNDGEMIEKLSGVILELLASPIILNAAKLCLQKRCIYNGQRINQLDDTFETDKARGDFIPASFYALRENVTPFLSGIGSFLSKVK